MPTERMDRILQWATPYRHSPYAPSPKPRACRSLYHPCRLLQGARSRFQGYGGREKCQQSAWTGFCSGPHRTDTVHMLLALNLGLAGLFTIHVDSCKGLDLDFRATVGVKNANRAHGPDFAVGHTVQTQSICSR